MFKNFVFHPLLFGFFPILFLYSHNIGHVSLEQLVSPLYITFFITVTAWLICQYIYKDRYKSGIVTSLFLILFFSYGHIFDLLPSQPISLRYHAFLLSCWCFLFLFGARYIKRLDYSFIQLNHGLNTAAVILIVVPFLGSLTSPTSSLSLGEEAQAAILPKLNTSHLSKPERLPDIYFIVLDAYARADTLQKIFKYDNSKFLGFLKNKGFSVAEKSRANYNQTWLALSSALNLTYINNLVGKHGMEASNRAPLKDLIQHNKAVPFLKHYGYKFVSFRSGQSFTDMKGADVPMPARPSLNEFNVTLLSATPLPGLFYEVGKLFGNAHNAYQAHRDRINYAFDHLPDLAGKESPLFVFAHILGPHPPFVFGPNGEPIDPDRRYWIGDGTAFFNKGGTIEEYLTNYTGEVEYLNKRLQETIEKILTNSAEPPIIIIQSDHGSRLELDWLDANNTNFQEAFSILSAFYLPGMTAPVPEGISPVNTFRFIFNTYFGTNYEMLEDRSFYSTWDEPYQLLEVTDQVT